MSNYPRILQLDPILKRKSLFLFGPRQTGKSSFLKLNYPDALYIDLLLNDNFSSLFKNPELLRKRVELFIKNNDSNIIIIDEVQKIPTLLNEVHALIEKHKSLRFILTGSSTRKLKAQGVNLLGGRASKSELFPLTFAEIILEENSFDYMKAMTSGLLPSIYNSEDAYDDLLDYAGFYLKDEIKQEGYVRNLNIFAEFLRLAALSNTQQINYSNFANDAQISTVTAKEYFEILEETLIGKQIHPFRHTEKRKVMTSCKFYFFDIGIVNGLVRRKELIEGTSDFGAAFEQLIYQELQAYISYFRKDFNLEYWRTTDKVEVDFVVYENLKNIFAIEIKSSKKLRPKDYSGLLKLQEEFPLKKKMVVSLVPHSFIEDNGVEVYNVSDFLSLLWAQDLF
ncbi:MAG: ATP-binding protein [Bacteriovorax sp.]|jgi:predicted AAA+ superfamily ATPase|nr:ATP-binding protein [Bacteriovorax sp.]